MEPVKLPEPVSVTCAEESPTFVTDVIPDWVNVAFAGTVAFNLIANAEEV